MVYADIILFIELFFSAPKNTLFTSFFTHVESCSQSRSIHDDALF